MSRVGPLFATLALLLSGCAGGPGADEGQVDAAATDASAPVFVDRTNATALGGGTGDSCFNAFGPMGEGVGEIAVNRDGDAIRFEFKGVRASAMLQAHLRVTLTPSDDSTVILASGTAERLVVLDLLRQDLEGIRHVAYHAYVCDAETGAAPLDVEVAASFFRGSVPADYTAFPSITSA